VFLNNRRVIPDGTCWCGCGDVVGDGVYFRSGHDKVAESAVIELEYGTVVGFLVAHGYGPDGKNPRELLAQRRMHVPTPRYRVLNERHLGDGSTLRFTPKHRFVPGTLSALVAGSPADASEDSAGDYLEFQQAPARGATIALSYSHVDLERRH
jgi:hypothetical protein